MRYPRNCLAYEVQCEPDQQRFIRNGSIVEATGAIGERSIIWGKSDYQRYGTPVCLGVVARKELIRGEERPSKDCRMLGGHYQIGIVFEALRPLTPAAREFLAIAKAAR